MILAEKAQFGGPQIKMIEIKFLHVTVTLILSETSLSGFVILFSCVIESGRAWQRSFLRVLLHFRCIIYVVWSTILADERQEAETMYTRAVFCHRARTCAPSIQKAQKSTSAPSALQRRSLRRWKTIMFLVPAGCDSCCL